MRLNAQYRLIVRILEEMGEHVMLVCGIEDYH